MSMLHLRCNYEVPSRGISENLASEMLASQGFVSSPYQLLALRALAAVWQSKDDPAAAWVLACFQLLVAGLSIFAGPFLDSYLGSHDLPVEPCRSGMFGRSTVQGPAELAPDSSDLCNPRPRALRCRLEFMGSTPSLEKTLN